jgi:GNAT superfamily N-acetyltransferase
MSALAISVESPISKAALDAIDQGLDAHNAQFSPMEYEEFAVVLKDGDAVMGGVTAMAWAGMLFIKWFWVDASLRGQDHGTALLARMEDEGRARGCKRVYLDTFEFQARPFYEKFGYALFGEIAYPAGFKRHFLQKAL